MAEQTVEDWNIAMKETVAGLILTAAGQSPTLPQLRARANTVPDIFKLAENGAT